MSRNLISHSKGPGGSKYIFLLLIPPLISLSWEPFLQFRQNTEAPTGVRDKLETWQNAYEA